MYHLWTYWTRCCSFLAAEYSPFCNSIRKRKSRVVGGVEEGGGREMKEEGPQDLYDSLKDCFLFPWVYLDMSCNIFLQVQTVRLNLTIGKACSNSCKLLFFIDMSAKFEQTFWISKLLTLIYFAYLGGKTLMNCIYSEIISQTRKNHLYSQRVLQKTISFNRIIQNVTTVSGSGIQGCGAHFIPIHLSTSRKP